MSSPVRRSRRSRLPAPVSARGTARLAPNHHGIHLLRSKPVVDALVAAADVGPQSLVLDLGAGPGTLTVPLAATGARVIAVERDPAFVRELLRRFDGHPNVRVAAADLRSVPLPRRPFHVVASIPYALSTLLVRRLLHPVDSPLVAADLVVEWGFGRRLSAAVPRDLEGAWWAARYDIRTGRRIPRTMFQPRPAVDSVHLRIRRREELRGRPTLAVLYALLAAAYREPGAALRCILAELVPRGRTRAVAAAAGLGVTTAAETLVARQWATLARAVVAEPVYRRPRLPRAVASSRRRSRTGRDRLG